MTGAATASEKKRECFAPVPFRALGDKRLARADIAVLGVVAAHDRFRSNGRGCDAGRPRIAHLANCDLATMSHAVTRLEAFGYIGSRADPRDGRKRIYWVNYSDDDGRFMSGATNPTPKAAAANSMAHPQPIGGRSVTERPEIGGAPKRQTFEPASDSGPNIFPEREKIFGEAGNTHASRRASEGDVGKWRPIASHVSEIERRFRKGEIERRDALASLSRLHGEATENHDQSHIERVLSEIDCSADE